MSRLSQSQNEFRADLKCSRWTGLTLIGLFICSWTPYLSGAPLCSEIHLLSPFKTLKSGASAPGVSYFQGTAVQREAHSEEMAAAGRHSLSKLISQPVLEIGPFLNPLAESLAKHKRWIVWEYDQDAGQKIADSSSATVFQVDLNALTAPVWERFLAAQKNDLGFSVVVISSVLNYVDMPTVLGRVLGEMADNGILFVANTNVGDSKAMKTRLNGSQILEYLVTHHSEQIEILKGSQYHLQSFDGSRSGISLAIRVHKVRKQKIDLYDLALSLYVDFIAMPWNARYPSGSQNDHIQFWNSTDPIDVAKARADIRSKANNFLLSPKTNRLAETEQVVQAVEALIERVILVKQGSADFDRIRQDLEHPIREFFLPERRILLQALNLPIPDRRIYIIEHRSKLFQSMGHFK